MSNSYTKFYKIEFTIQKSTNNLKINSFLSSLAIYNIKNFHTLYYLIILIILFSTVPSSY